MKKNTVGIIGCGTIGSYLAKAVYEDMSQHADKVVVYDILVHKAEEVGKRIPCVSVAQSAEEVSERSDIIVEAVAPPVVEGLIQTAIQKRKDIMVLSIGGLLKNPGILDEARKAGIRVILPSGAVSGIDALKAAKLAGISEVTIVSRKPPRAVKGAPYLAEKGLDTDSIKEETVVFEGNAHEAIEAFPQSINVSALLSIAGIGAGRTKVKIIVSPEYAGNSHEVVIKAETGTIVTRTENVLSPENPRTSYIAVMSAVAALKGYFDTVHIGT